MLFTTHPFQSDQPAIPSIKTALVIGGVSSGGRRPTPDDAIEDMLAAGTWQTPSAGTTVQFHGTTRTWREIKADKNEGFEDDALENGYLSVQIDSPSEKEEILNAKGDSLVFVNGVPRAGDPYSNGYLNLPIHLQKGNNELLFVAGRGRISFSLKPVEKPIWIQTEDATLPDLLTTDTHNQLGSVVVCNAKDAFVSGLKLRTTDSKNRSVTVDTAPIPPQTDRKLILQIPAGSGLPLGKNRFQVELIKDGKTLDSATFEIEVKNPLDLQKRTFLSKVDSSVQYFAVRPATVPSPANALVLTLHGAGVEAYGQAAAYAAKSWATLVAPTNRRPYGFDWEGIGRLDAIEVLDLAKKTYPHDPERVDLTGHSMGGHGTWSIGTLYPNLFASISPSAGWISFWSYAGGWNPDPSTPALDLLRRSMNVGDTLSRVDNTLEENVYILHGAVDDNVPVQQARTMRAKLESIHHPHLEYHEQPGANHWWGNQCVDWPPIFQNIKDSRLDPNPKHVDFTTQDPSVSSTYGWVTIEQQETELAPSQVVGDKTSQGVKLQVTNVKRLRLTGIGGESTVTINGDVVLHSSDSGPLDLKLSQGKWVQAGAIGDEKGPIRGGPFKQVFNHHFMFVVGTKGTEEEKKWALTRAIFDAETMLYRGNGAVDIVLDKDFKPNRDRNRDVILFGNESTNSAWDGLIGRAPIVFKSGQVASKLFKEEGSDLGGLLLYPRQGERDTLVGAITGTGLPGFRQTDRLSLFSSGVDYPDWVIFSPTSPEKVRADGFFSEGWKLDPAQSAK